MEIMEIDSPSILSVAENHPQEEHEFGLEPEADPEQSLTWRWLANLIS
jgi:hypothetical protein